MTQPITTPETPEAIAERLARMLRKTEYCGHRLSCHALSRGSRGEVYIENRARCNCGIAEVAVALRARDERIEELEALIRELLETHRVSCQTKIAGLEAKLAALTAPPPSAEPSPPASDSSTVQRIAVDPQG